MAKAAAVDFWKNEPEALEMLRLDRTLVKPCEMKKGDRDGYPDGHMYVKFWSKKQPEVVDQYKKSINEADRPGFYPGCWARAVYTPVPYKNGSNYGVMLALHCLQKVRDDEPLGNPTVSADDAFDPVDDGSGNKPWDGAEPGSKPITADDCPF